MLEKYVKDFDRWNRKKKSIDLIDGYLMFKERDIWWCSLGCNIGSELDGKNEDFERPVIIFRIFNEDTAWIIPIISRKIADGSAQEYDLTRDGWPRIADVSQLKLISTKRLLRYLGKIPFDDFQKIRRIYKNLS